MGCDKVEEILLKSHDEGVYEQVLEESSNLTGHFYTYGDKIETAYKIVKAQIKKNKSNKLKENKL